jgi:hypothetical protein
MSDVQILIKDNEQQPCHLDGILTLPPEQEKNSKRRIVVFAHGSGHSGNFCFLFVLLLPLFFPFANVFS